MSDERDLVIRLEESGSIGLDLSPGCSLCWEAAKEIRRLRQQVQGHCGRIAAQSEILTNKAENK